VRYGNREVFIKHYPISIDHDALERVASRPEVIKNRDLLRKLAGDRKLMVRVDRLELSKNIPRGLASYEFFLSEHPEWHGRVIFANFLYPSREALPEYKDLRLQIEGMSAALNKRFGKPGWQPVHLDISDDYPRSVAALMEFDALLVNPVADGMNLVAKEGAVLNTREGLIILSMATGAYQEMRGGAIAINPFDIEETARAIWKSLETTGRKRKAMAKTAVEVVEANTSFKWFLQQMRALRKVEKQRGQILPEHMEMPATPRYETFE
jgi:trehalose 6-phosphate synthase